MTLSIEAKPCDGLLRVDSSEQGGRVGECDAAPSSVTLFRVDEDIEIPYQAVRRQTKEAYLIEFEARNEIWLPKRHISVDPNRHVVTMPKWLAQREELLDEAF